MTEPVRGSLGHLKAIDERITVFCPNAHGRQIDLDRAIERFGADFLIIPNRAEFLAAFRCSRCELVASELIMTPGNTGPM